MDRQGKYQEATRGGGREGRRGGNEHQSPAHGVNDDTEIGQEKACQMHGTLRSLYATAKTLLMTGRQHSLEQNRSTLLYITWSFEDSLV